MSPYENGHMSFIAKLETHFNFIEVQLWCGVYYRQCIGNVHYLSWTILVWWKYAHVLAWLMGYKPSHHWHRIAVKVAHWSLPSRFLEYAFLDHQSWKFRTHPFLQGSWNTRSLMIKVENSEPIPPCAWFAEKHWNCLGPRIVKTKKRVNKKSRIGTHPSKVQRKGEHKSSKEKNKSAPNHCLPGAPPAENDCVSSINECF
jgi:hypothetical protein